MSKTPDSMLFTEKHFPQSFLEFVGQGQAVSVTKNWAEDWQKGKPGKPLLFYGPPGVGKTCLAYLTAKSYAWEVFELNASDLRNKDVVNRVVAGAAFNASFSGNKRLVLLDEVDGLQGVKDKGGGKAIIDILKQSQNPVILTANKIYSKDKRLDSIKAYCQEVKFTKIMSPSIAKRLREVCLKEEIDFDMEVLKALAQTSSGDLRAALLDLQSLTVLANKITLEDLEKAGFREREQDIFSVLEKIFKSKNMSEIRRLRTALDIDIDLLKKWVEENIPRVYKKGNDMENAFQQLSKADIFDGRIMRRQHWSFLRYSSELITSGVALAKDNEYHGWLQLQFPLLLKTLSLARSDKAIKTSIASKMSKLMHSSINQVVKSDLPYLKMLLEDKKVAPYIIAEFDFNEKEVAFLLNTKPDRKKVIKLIEEARKLQLEKIKSKKQASFENPQKETKEKTKKIEENINLKVDEGQKTLFG